MTWVFITFTMRSKSPAVSLGGRVHVIDVLFVSIISQGFELIVTVVSKLFTLNPEPLIVNKELPFINPVKVLDS